MSEPIESWHHDAPLSAVLASTFRGKLCTSILQNRRVVAIEPDQVIYELGDRDRTLFFLRKGFAKIGTITADGHEIIYDIRREGDVLGELCAGGGPRQDRAVALEACDIVAVPLDDVLAAVQNDRALLGQLIEMLCASLADAYDQLNSVAFGSTLERVVKLLQRLGAQLGRPTDKGAGKGSEKGIEIPTYLTQEEIAQMIAVRRERVSLAMNFLRDRGAVQYSRRGYLVLNLDALGTYESVTAGAETVAVLPPR